MCITDVTIEMFINHNLITFHHHLYRQPDQHFTAIECMLEDHQKYLEWVGNRFHKWASEIGINTNEVVNEILASSRTEYQNIFITGVTGSGKAYMAFVHLVWRLVSSIILLNTLDFRICSLN